MAVKNAVAAELSVNSNLIKVSGVSPYPKTSETHNQGVDHCGAGWRVQQLDGRLAKRPHQ